MPRSAVSAVTITRALIELAHLMEGHECFQGRNFDPKLMSLAIETLIAARAGKPVRAGDLSKRLQIRRGTVDRHLKSLARLAREMDDDYCIDLHNGSARPLSSKLLRDGFNAIAKAIT